MGTVGNLVLLIVSGIVGLFASLVQLYMVGFIMDIFVPITVDHSPKWHNPLCLEKWPILNNFILLLLFWIQHSAMPRGPVKRMIRYCMSEDYYRPLYSFVAAAYILATFYFWVPIPLVVWDVRLPAIRSIIYGISALCWFGLSVSLLCLDPLGLLGIRDPLYQLLGCGGCDTDVASAHLHGPLKNPGPETEVQLGVALAILYLVSIWYREKKFKLVSTGLYGLMRHPVYSFLILSVWITPTMTMGHLLLSVMFTAYILIAVQLYEEPDLIKQMGSEYIEYMKTTPAYIPNIPFFTKPKNI